jgi:hypothetical protein
MTFSLAVPTSSIIAYHPDDKYLVAVLEQAEKHRGRLTIAGGKIELPRQNARQCAVEEFDQECGGKGCTLDDIKLWAIKTDPYSDVRESKLGKLTHNLCPELLRDVPVIGHYGAPDHIYTASAIGTPYPKDGEAKQCFFFDVRTIEITADEKDSKFGAQQDLYLAVYRLYLDGRAVEPDDFVDFNALRHKLPGLLR